MIVVYIILLAASLLFYIQFEGAFSFYLFCFVAAYPVVFGILTYMAKRKLRISFEAAEQSAPKGSSVPVSIIIDNDSHLPVPDCDITISYRTEYGSHCDTFRIHTPVFANNSQKLTVRLSYRHYGPLNVEITRVRIFDILHIIRMRIKSSGSLFSTRIVVFPDHIPLTNKVNDYFELGLESDVYSKVKKGDDPSEIFDIHKYNEGDKISRIHWKLSAKQDEMMVKDYSLPITKGIMIAVDLSRTFSGSSSLDKLDTVIDAVSAISLHLAETEVVHTVMWTCSGTSDYENRTVDSFESYAETVRELIRNGLKGSAKSPVDIISDLTTGVPKYAHIIYCSDNVPETDKTRLTESGYSFRYTVLDCGIDPEAGYTDNLLSVIPLRTGAVAESLESIVI